MQNMHINVTFKMTCSTIWGSGRFNLHLWGARGLWLMCVLCTEVITEVRERECQENFQILVMWLKKTEAGIYKTLRCICEWVLESCQFGVCFVWLFPIFGWANTDARMRTIWAPEVSCIQPSPVVDLRLKQRRPKGCDHMHRLTSLKPGHQQPQTLSAPKVWDSEILTTYFAFKKKKTPLSSGEPSQASQCSFRASVASSDFL